jgi:hypothetical protein
MTSEQLVVGSSFGLARPVVNPSLVSVILLAGAARRVVYHAGTAPAAPGSQAVVTSPGGSGTGSRPRARTPSPRQAPSLPMPAAPERRTSKLVNRDHTSLSSAVDAVQLHGVGSTMRTRFTTHVDVFCTSSIPVSRCSGSDPPRRARRQLCVPQPGSTTCHWSAAFKRGNGKFQESAENNELHGKRLEQRRGKGWVPVEGSKDESCTAKEAPGLPPPASSAVLCQLI